jgi:hypothetical protein
MRTAITIILLVSFSVAMAQSPTNGVARAGSNNVAEVWNAGAGDWTDIETFWSRYAKRTGGLTWGPSEQYPPYTDVEEYDTLLIELPQGVCLMQFFHSRWRRANDVQRWDDAFNLYGGCPYVFE